MTDESSFLGITFGSDTIPHLIFLDFKTKLKQISRLCRFGYVIALSKKRQGIIDAVRQRDVNATFGGSHMIVMNCQIVSVSKVYQLSTSLERTSLTRSRARAVNFCHLQFTRVFPHEITVRCVDAFKKN